LREVICRPMFDSLLPVRRLMCARNARGAIEWAHYTPLRSRGGNHLAANQARKKKGGESQAAVTSQGGWGCRWAVLWVLPRLTARDPAKGRRPRMASK